MVSKEATYSCGTALEFHQLRCHEAPRPYSNVLTRNEEKLTIISERSLRVQSERGAT